VEIEVQARMRGRGNRRVDNAAAGEVTGEDEVMLVAEGNGRASHRQTLEY
jgi:hypothetical protein